MARQRLCAAVAAIALSATAAAAQDTRATPAPDTPSRAVGRTHNCADYYPDMSQRLNETGDVLVSYDVGADGAISNVKVAKSSGFARLDLAAVLCVTERWRNVPARRGGVAVSSPRHQAIIRFVLRGGSAESNVDLLVSWLAGSLVFGSGVMLVLGRWVFRSRACPNCHHINRSIVPFVDAGYCSSCGVKFARPA